MREEFAFKILPDASEDYNKLVERVKRVTLKLASERIDRSPLKLSPEVEDKCTRDGHLLAAMVASRDAARQAGIRSSVIILSSARSLQRIDEIFKNEIGRPDGVVSTAAVGCLLALTPGAKMGMSTLRGVLFDLDLSRRLTPYQSFAYRLIALSGEFNMPYSRRVTLEKDLGHRLIQDAREYGEPLKTVKKKVLAFEDPERSAKIVLDVLTRINRKS